MAITKLSVYFEQTIEFSHPVLHDRNQNCITIYSYTEDSIFDVSSNYTRINWRYQHHIGRTNHWFMVHAIGKFAQKLISASLHKDNTSHALHTILLNSS